MGLFGQTAGQKGEPSSCHWLVVAIRQDWPPALASGENPSIPAGSGAHRSVIEEEVVDDARQHRQKGQDENGHQSNHPVAQSKKKT